MSDELEKLSNQQLSECFAVEVAGFYKRETPRDGGLRAYSVVETGAWREIREEGALGQPEDLADYSTSADAVMPWLEKSCSLQRFCLSEVYPEIPRTDGTVSKKIWHVTIIGTGALGGLHNIVGTASNFPRAACIALIRAKRIPR